MGAIKMVLDPGRFELYTFFNQPTSDISLTELIFARNWSKLENSLKATPMLLYVFLFFLAIQVLKLLGLVFSASRLVKNGFVLLMALYFVGITGPVGAARFFVPVSVLALVFSALGWERALHFFKKRSKSK
jgi:hypothetical protein